MVEFLISRTCNIYKCGSNKKPCEKAFRKKIAGEEEWVVKINSLDELLCLSEDLGSLILETPGKFGSNIPGIEIYDDYRE